jgi:hypothetical protein
MGASVAVYFGLSIVPNRPPDPSIYLLIMVWPTLLRELAQKAAGSFGPNSWVTNEIGAKMLHFSTAVI